MTDAIRLSSVVSFGGDLIGEKDSSVTVGLTLAKIHKIMNQMNNVTKINQIIKILQY